MPCADSQGRGLATVAVKEAIALVFERTPAQSVVGITDSPNSPSIRLLERVGMRKLDTRDAGFRGEPCVEFVYSLSRKFDD